MSNRRPPILLPRQRRGLVFGFLGPTGGDNINSLPVRPVPLSLATRKWRSGLGWREFLALQGDVLHVVPAGNSGRYGSELQNSERRNEPLPVSRQQVEPVCAAGPLPKALRVPAEG